MARVLLVTNSGRVGCWTKLSDEQRATVLQHRNIVHVQPQRPGSFQPGSLPAEVKEDVALTHLLFWGAYPRFGTFDEGGYEDNNEFKAARPEMVVVQLQDNSTFEDVVAFLDSLV